MIFLGILTVNFEAELNEVHTTMKVIPLRSQPETILMSSDLKKIARDIILTFCSRTEDIVDR